MIDIVVSQSYARAASWGATYSGTYTDTDGSHMSSTTDGPDTSATNEVIFGTYSSGTYEVDFYGLTSEDSSTQTLPTVTTVEDSSLTQTSFTTTERTFTIVARNFDDVTSSADSIYQGINGATITTQQFRGPVSYELHSVVLDNHELGVVYPNELNFPDQGITFTDATTYAKQATFSYSNVPAIGTGNSPQAITATVGSGTFTETFYSEDYSASYSYSYSYLNQLPWPAESSTGSTAVAVTELIVGGYLPTGTVGYSVSVAGTSQGYYPVTFTVPAGFSTIKTAYYSSQAVQAGVAYNVTTSGQMITSENIYSVGPDVSYISNSYFHADSSSTTFTLGPMDDFTPHDDQFALFASVLVPGGLVSPNGGFTSRTPHLSFVGQIPGMTLSGYPYALAEPGVSVPMPFMDFTSRIYNETNDTFLTMNWSDGLFYYTTKDNNASASGQLSYDPQGNVPISASVVDGFYRTTGNITAYMPFPGVLATYIGTNSGVTSFTCATTKSYAYSAGCSFEFYPAIVGPTVLTYSRYIAQPLPDTYIDV